MQYSKEENAPAQDNELPKITAQEYAFAVGVTKGGLSQAAAYREAYPESRHWKPQSVWTEASKLRRRPDVARWIAALQADMAREANYTRTQAVQTMIDVAERAMNEGKYIAVINAVQLACKLEGHLSDKQDSTEKGKADSLLSQIAKQFGPEMAQAAAKRLGLEAETVH